MPSPLSIVIPSHNRPDLLRACLRAVARHAPPGTDVVVVDDGSPAGAASACASEFPGVRALRLPRRRGFCAAANAGVRAALHPVVEMLNDDTEVTAGWAGPALAAFADPSVAAVAPLVLRPPSAPGEPPTVDSAGDRYFVGGVAGKRGHGEPLGPRWLVGGPVFGASASSAFYRRDALLAVGGFPEEFGAYFEDVDVSFRLHRAGFRILYQPASRVWHRVGSSYGAPARALLARQARNEELVFWRNLPAPLLLRCLPLHLGVLGAKALLRWRRGELLPFLWGKLCALTRLPQTLRHRLRLRLAPHSPCGGGAGGEGRDLADWCLEPRFWGLPPAPR